MQCPQGQRIREFLEGSTKCHIKGMRAAIEGGLVDKPDYMIPVKVAELIEYDFPNYIGPHTQTPTLR